MKKVLLASLLACVAVASALPFASAQQPVSLGTGQPAAAPCALPDAEYTAYTNAMNTADPKAKAAAIEAYLTAFPQSACPDTRSNTLQLLMGTYSQFDAAKTLDAANRVLQLDPNDLRALTFEAALIKGNGDNATDPAAKLAAYDSAAGFAKKGLVAPKPATMADPAFKTLQTTAFPFFYSAIGIDDLTKKDYAGAISAYKTELAFVPIAQTTSPQGQLPDTYELALAYYQSVPPDLLDCAFYAARFVAYAPEPFKSQVAPTAKYCYKTFHGGNDGYDDFAAKAAANLNPPDGLFAGVKPAPTPADYVAQAIASTPDLGTLAIDDKEFILQNGTPEQAAKVWDTVKGKSVEIPGALVVASTATQIQVAVSGGAVQSKTADFTFNLAPPDPLPDLKPHPTPAEKAAYTKKKAAADKLAADIAAATAVGKTVTLDGTYDSFTPNPIMITLSAGSVVLPKAAPPKPVAHHPAAKKK
jgi:hypothetical protein